MDIDDAPARFEWWARFKKARLMQRLTRRRRAYFAGQLRSDRFWQKRVEDVESRVEESVDRLFDHLDAKFKKFEEKVHERIKDMNAGLKREQKFVLDTVTDQSRKTTDYLHDTYKTQVESLQDQVASLHENFNAEVKSVNDVRQQLTTKLYEAEKLVQRVKLEDDEAKQRVQEILNQTAEFVRRHTSLGELEKELFSLSMKTSKDRVPVTKTLPSN